MDNMAYLQQISAGSSNRVAPKKQKADNPLSKFFNIWTALIGGGILIILIICLVLVSVFSKVETVDNDVLKRSYFAGKLLNKEILDIYTKDVKNSDIRNMSASLEGVIDEMVLNQKAQLEEKYGIMADSIQPANDAILLEENNKIAELDSVLYSGKLNGILDRVFLREMTMHIVYIMSYQTELMERSEDEEIKATSKKAYENLSNIYDRFHDFKSPTL